MLRLTLCALLTVIVLILSPRTGISQLHIHHMTVQADTLFIYGHFGSDSIVVIQDGGVQVPLRSSDTLVLLRISKGSNRGYAFQVADADDTSNTRWISYWTVWAQFEREYALHPNEWQRIDAVTVEVGDISSYLLEPGMPASAQIGNLKITPGENYSFDHFSIVIAMQDTAILRPAMPPYRLEVQHEPWFRIRNEIGGIEQYSPPPDSVLITWPYPTYRRPLRDQLHPEDTLRFSWRPAVGAVVHQLQIRKRDSLIVDTTMDQAAFSLSALDPRTTYSWRLRDTSSEVSYDWSSWWTFTTDKLDRIQPTYRMQRSDYARTITARDTGLYASGLKQIEVQANNDSEARILPGRLVNGTCELTPRSITIEQIDTTIAIHYAVITTDCEDNTITLYDSIPAHPYVESGGVEAIDPSESIRDARAVKRGERFTFDGAGRDRNVAVYDVAGNEVAISLDRTGGGMSLTTEDLTPGLYTVVVLGERTVKKQLLLIQP